MTSTKKLILILTGFFFILAGIFLNNWQAKNRQTTIKQTQKSHDTIKVTIIGEVTTPQIAHLPKGTTYKQAIAQAGGTNPYAATRRVKLFSNEKVTSFDLENGKPPALTNSCIIEVPLQVWTEYPTYKTYRIQGRKKLSLTEIHNTLAPKFDGLFVKNYFSDSGTLDLRYDRKKSFLRFLIQPAKPEISSFDSEDEIFTYDISAPPSLASSPPSPEALKLIDELSTLVSGKLQK